MASYSSLLSQIDTAIEALLTGQHESYTIGARSVTRLDLDDLFSWRERVAVAAQRESSGSAVHVAKMQRRSQ